MKKEIYKQIDNKLYQHIHCSRIKSLRRRRRKFVNHHFNLNFRFFFHFDIKRFSLPMRFFLILFRIIFFVFRSSSSFFFLSMKLFGKFSSSFSIKRRINSQALDWIDFEPNEFFFEWFDTERHFSYDVNQSIDIRMSKFQKVRLSDWWILIEIGWNISHRFIW